MAIEAIPAPVWFLAFGGLLGLHAMASAKLVLTSPSFGDGKAIPTTHAYTGVAGAKNLSPALRWTEAPAGTKSFALACIDHHPVANNWIHWMVINIPSTAHELPEGASQSTKLPSGSKELKNSFGTVGWGGPQPPPGSGIHPYEFVLYALNTDSLNLQESTSLSTFNKALEGKVLATAKLVGTFQR
jgi:Raf kinase inhibitor-like YbhB/YbcL family protein